jgi:hypothetical protein
MSYQSHHVGVSWELWGIPGGEDPAGLLWELRGRAGGHPRVPKEQLPASHDDSVT